MGWGLWTLLLTASINQASNKHSSTSPVSTVEASPLPVHETQSQRIHSQLLKVNQALLRIDEGVEPCLTQPCQKERHYIADEIASQSLIWEDLWLPQRTIALRSLRRILRNPGRISNRDSFDVKDELVWHSFELTLRESQSLFPWLRRLQTDPQLFEVIRRFWNIGGVELAFLQFELSRHMSIRDSYDDISKDPLLQRLSRRMAQLSSSVGVAYEDTLALFLQAEETSFGLSTSTDEVQSYQTIMMIRNLARLYTLKIMLADAEIFDDAFHRTASRFENNLQSLSKLIVRFNEITLGVSGLKNLYGIERRSRSLPLEVPSLEWDISLASFWSKTIDTVASVYGYSLGRASFGLLAAGTLASAPQWLHIYKETTLFDIWSHHKARRLQDRLTAIEENDRIFQALQKQRESILLRLRKNFVGHKRKLEAELQNLLQQDY